MDKNKTNLLYAEFISAFGYLDRILQAIVHYGTLSSDPVVMDLCLGLDKELTHTLNDQLISPQLGTRPLATARPVKEILDWYQSLYKFLESMLKLGIEIDSLVTFTVPLINQIYIHSQKLHAEIAKKTSLSVDFPRINLTQLIEHPGISEIPLFFLDEKRLVRESEEGQILSLNFRRIDRYQELLKLGHQKVYEKKYAEALNFFHKAQSLNDTAEVLTLIGWSYYLSGDVPKAKDFCLRAIKKDPDFGPPYNDMGSYLLSENRFDESLKWFDLAKKCRNYQHREYPFINAGRAYMNKKDYSNALAEFEKALSFTPYNKELIDTINRLRASLKKATTKDIFEDQPMQ